MKLRRKVKSIVVATSDYDITRIFSIMAAKIISMELNVSLRIVDEEWLMKNGFKPYVPSFLAELESGEILLIRVGGMLDHKELANLLAEEIEEKI